VRVVSLVPSATESLRALGIEPVACTRFCEQPDLPTVGGTKDPDVDAIIGLEPDLVVVNDEENRYEDAARLVDAGIPMHSMSPRSVADVGRAVGALAEVCEVAMLSPFEPGVWDEWLADQDAGRDPGARSVCTFVWRRPWTATSGSTYGSSVLDLLGFTNVFAAESDRYPVVTLEEVAMYHPDVVVLPDEPYPFKVRHEAEVREGIAGATPVLVDGRDLFWWGVRTPEAVERLRLRLRG
jgi:ABC-type Fe3+-hydroxamate transport system substrate-binding protein